MRRRGSVLIIVLITLVFASVALIAFMDKAMNDLLIDHRDAMNRRLRMEAYSALDTTLAVLEDFREANNGLHSPAEGWSDPLGFAGYTPEEGHTIDVTFDDESGKISLPHADAPALSRLFQSWGVQQTDADTYADAMMGWMQKEHVYSTPISPDYEESPIPYEPPLRPMRSYSELAAIDKVRDFFYDANGQPNDNWRRFVDSVSLLDFTKSNINGARPGALAALGQFNELQQQTLQQYLSGSGQYQNQGNGFIKDVTQAGAIIGPGGDTTAFSTTISALRIIITVHEGRSEFRVGAVVTPQNGGAKVVQVNATSQKKQTSSTSNQTAAQSPNAPSQSQSTSTSSSGSNQTGATANLRYPFTLLEIRENDEIPAAPSTPTPAS